jgi:hypothetical protein
MLGRITIQDYAYPEGGDFVLTIESKTVQEHIMVGAVWDQVENGCDNTLHNRDPNEDRLTRSR